MEKNQEISIVYANEIKLIIHPNGTSFINRMNSSFEGLFR